MFFKQITLTHFYSKGFRRACNFGFLHPNCRRLIALLHLLFRVVPSVAGGVGQDAGPILCTCCGAVMVIVRTQLRSVPCEVVPVPIVIAQAR